MYKLSDDYILLSYNHITEKSTYVAILLYFFINIYVMYFILYYYSTHILHI